MKKIVKSLLLVVLTIVTIGIVNVDAYVFEPNSVTINVPENKVIKLNSAEISTGNYNGSYLIGTYMFDILHPNELFGGVLRAKHIMLAAKTIDSESLDDMKIYYVDGTNVVDAFTGESVNIGTVNISIKNLQEVEANIVDDSIPTPYLYDPPIGYSAGVEINPLDENHKEYYQTLAVEIEGDADFIELASSKKENGYYTPNYISQQIANVSADYMDVVVFRMMNYGEAEYFKARACRMVDYSTENFTCSDWSNTLYLRQDLEMFDYDGLGNEQPDGMYSSFMNSDRIYLDLYGSESNTTSGKKLLETKKASFTSGYYLVNINGDEGPYTLDYIHENYPGVTICDDIGYESWEYEQLSCYEYRSTNYALFDTRLNDNEYRYLYVRPYVINSDGKKVYGPQSERKLFANPVDTNDNYKLSLYDDYDCTIYGSGYYWSQYCNISNYVLEKNNLPDYETQYGPIYIYASQIGKDLPTQFIDTLDEDDDVALDSEFFENNFDLTELAYNSFNIQAKTVVYTNDGVFYTAFGEPATLSLYYDTDW